MYEYSRLPALEPEHLDRSQWQKPKTTRRNLQPPKAERLINLWVDGKIIFGRVYDGSDEADKKNGYEYWKNETGCGFWMLHGKKRESFDFHDAQNVISDDGVPVHGLRFPLDGTMVEIEAFCDTQRKSSCFIKVLITNETAQTVAPILSFLLRSDTIKNLAGAADHYHVYRSNLLTWQEESIPTWKQKGDVFTDGKYVLSVWGGALPAWDAKAGTLDWHPVLSAGESRTMFFALNEGEDIALDYAAQKENTEQFWRLELARLNKLPAAWKQDPETVKMVRHMVAQMLQHVTCCEGKDYYFMRQGGLRCIGFPGDTMWVFDVLPRLGEFSDYLEPVFDTYFNIMQQANGEIVNIGIYWAMVTSTVLSAFGNYCKYSGQAGNRIFEKYCDKAFAGFEWIRRTRRQTLDSDTLVRGLFPPLRACDYAQVYQNWQITDNYNIMNLRPFAQILRQHNDPRAVAVQEEIDQYVEVMRACMQPHLEAQKDSDELYIPLCPDGNDRDLVKDDFPMYHHPKFILNGIIGPEYRDRIYRWFINSNRSNGVLYARTIVQSQGNVWYVSAAEISWFQLYMLNGEYDKMRQILETQRKYTVTEEYYMMERIIIGQPYYLPWTPNVSAMARLLWMMLAVDELERAC